MDLERQSEVAKELARNRAAGIVSKLSLADIADVAQALAVQSAATTEFARDVVGYTLVGTSAGVRRTLGLEEPIFGTIAQGSLVRESHPSFRIPQGFIGAQCELVFTIGPIPTDASLVNRAALERTILGCQPGIGLLGRRTASPSSNLGALADYSLHVATICGRYCDGLLECDLGAIIVQASIDGNEISRAAANTVMGHPLNAIAWLADELRSKGSWLSPGDIVATGSCTPVLQMLPGQHLEVDFGPIGRVSCDFE